MKVKVTNLATNTVVEYTSIREAAFSLNISKTTLIEYILKSKQK